MLSFDHFIALKSKEECDLRVAVFVDKTVYSFDDVFEASVQLLTLIILVWFGCFFLEKLVLLNFPTFVKSQIAFPLVGSVILR